jgi:hypothetical protein
MGGKDRTKALPAICLEIEFDLMQYVPSPSETMRATRNAIMLSVRTRTATQEPNGGPVLTRAKWMRGYKAHDSWRDVPSGSADWLTTASARGAFAEVADFGCGQWNFARFRVSDALTSLTADCLVASKAFRHSAWPSTSRSEVPHTASSRYPIFS